MDAERTVFGVTAEFNPFHSGHARLAEAARTEFGAGFVVAVMSGDFVQRGTPAVFDKWSRAEAAIKGGYDLVLELPAALAVRHGGDFAANAVDILAGTGMVTDIIFGSESGDIDILRSMAENLTLAEEKGGERIRILREQGMSFPAARQQAAEEILREEGRGDDVHFPGSPNDILGAEYIRALSAYPGITPHTIKRDSDHHGSAREIRMSMLNDPVQGPKLRSMESRWFDLIRYAVLTKGPDYIDCTPSGGEGLGNRALKQLRYASDAEDLVERVRSKRYTASRIRRMFAQTVLGILRKDETAPYIRVLAAGPEGRKLLRAMTDGERNVIPLVSDPLRTSGIPAADAVIAGEIRAADIYSLLTGEDMYRSSDMVRKPFVR